MYFFYHFNSFIKFSPVFIDILFSILIKQFFTFYSIFYFIFYFHYFSLTNKKKQGKILQDSQMMLESRKWEKRKKIEKYFFFWIMRQRIKCIEK